MNKYEIKSKETKKKLCESYLDLYGKKDINQITIKNITDNAKYNRGTFYVHYRDIYDMHDKIKKAVIENIQNEFKTVMESSKQDFNIMSKTIINIYTNNEKYLLPFITKDVNFKEDLKQELKPILEEIFNIDLSKNKYVEYLIEYHLSSLLGTLNYWVNEKQNVSIDELYNLIKNIITKGILNVIKEL